jgi:hypothetical protein
MPIVPPIVCQIIAFVVWFVYASFFEWFVHRHIMHEKRFPLHDAFRGHTLVHHQLYKGDSYLVRMKGRPPHIMLRWYAFPGMIAAHLPIFFLFQWLTGLPTFWGALAGTTLYFVGYEYTHYLMHVPRDHYVERFRWFKFLREHHRLHHKYMLRNMNVFIPLADLCLGTLVTSEGWRSKPSKRQRILAKRREVTTNQTSSSES